MQQGDLVAQLYHSMVIFFEEALFKISELYNELIQNLESLISGVDVSIQRNPSSAPETQLKNYASKDSGATILSSSKGIKNSGAILSKNIEEYLILPECNNG